MTIKGIEAKSGMTRANIRFYESEGLLAPARSANGYRDYSEEDLETLRRVGLLRRLGLSLEEIKQLQSGRRALSDALEQHLFRLEEAQAKLGRAEEVCREMCSDGADYQTLDAQRYLAALERGPRRSIPAPQFASDVAPKVYAPWRRFFARSLDLSLCALLWLALQLLVFRLNPVNLSAGLLNAWTELLLMLFLEPLLLRLFGATPGKWILGLRVTDEDGERLSYSKGLRRTFRVIRSGLGLGIPIWNLCRLWKSWKGCDQGETLPWEEESTLVLKDERGWRCAVMAVAMLLVPLLSVALVCRPTVPAPNRGDLTAEEFCENYNRLAKYYEVDDGLLLDSSGGWVEAATGDAVILELDRKPPVFDFTVSDGVVTGLSFTRTLENSGLWPDDCQDEMQLAVLAMVGGRLKEVEGLLELIAGSRFQDFCGSACGVTAACEVSYSGYDLLNEGAGAALSPREGEETGYTIVFSLEKD